ncbi:unnamed protein product [Discula destructiva]
MASAQSSCSNNMMDSFGTESPAQYERDLRSEHHEWKRTKDANAKWLFGTTVPGAYQPGSRLWWQEGAGDVDVKPRPKGKPSEIHALDHKDKHNINKYARTTGRIRDLPSLRVRHRVSAQEEIDEAARSVLDYLPGSPQQHTPNPMDNVLYSFDRVDSPGRPLTLEVFVKTTGRETEKFVEKEYEVIDANGDMLKGRKARRNLRRGTATGDKSADDDFQVDEDGFELV